MGGITLWVRSVLRRSMGATVVLAVFAGLAAGVLGAGIQAARRADGAVERSVAHSRSYDVIVSACPAEAGNPDELTFPEVLAKCVSNDQTRRFANEVLAPMPQVESWTTVGTFVAGIVDPVSPNGWGEGILVQGIGSADPVGVVKRQILVDGRFAQDQAPDELVIGEVAASSGRIRVGDKLHLASWKQPDLDSAFDAGLPPQTSPFDSTVVGIVRTGKDLQLVQANETGTFLPDGLYAGPGWTAAHGSSMATYGFAAAARLVDGPHGSEAFKTALREHSAGWAISSPDSLSDVDLSTLHRAVEAERQALVITAFIGLVAAVVFVGLTLARQLRRELADGATLSALGLTRRGVMFSAVIRSLAIAPLSVVISCATIAAMSPLGPLGIARRMEYSHPIRYDWVVLGGVIVALPVLFAAVALASTMFAIRSAHRPLRLTRRASAPPLSAVPRAAMNFVRGPSPRLAVCVGAVAVAGIVAAGGLTASFDGVVGHPEKYGAWWDVAVGQYSEADAEQAGVDTILSNPAVTDAAGFLEDTSTALVDGVGTPFITLVPYIGHPHTVMASGREPASADEVALGASTARRLHKAIGDTVTITSAAVADLSETATVTGIAVLSNPVSGATNAGDGVVLHLDLARRLDIGSHVPQSIVIRLSPSVDRATAMRSVFDDFPGSARTATPQADLSNLERLRSVPWLIAALVGCLALASLVHALVTLLQRHARDLAVLGALGLTKRQRRRVGLAASLAIGIGCVLLGVPLGIALGRLIWTVVARRISIPSGAVLPWMPTVAAPVAALAAAGGVAVLATRWVTRGTSAVQLHTE